MKIHAQTEPYNKTDSLQKTGKPSDDSRLRQACADFEAILLDTMFQSMRKTLSGDDVFGKSLGRDIYESMYYTQMSKELAEGGNGIGLGEVLYRQLSNRIKNTTNQSTPPGSGPPEPVKPKAARQDQFQKSGQSSDRYIDVK